MSSGTLNELESEEGEFKHKLGDYLVSGTSLGQGTYAKVRLAKYKSSNELYAIKIIRKPEVDQEKHYTRIKREVENLKGLEHKFIIQLHDVFQTKRFICIVMEYATKGDLYDYIKSQPQGRLTECEALKIFSQMVEAIAYMHNNLVVHRDLKPENVLLDENYNVKLADFGFSRQFNPDSYLTTCCGSIGYAAPELLLGEKYVGPAADIWSLGVILYTMLVGNGPFIVEEGRMNKEVEEKMIAAQYDDSIHLTDFTRKIISKMLRPQKRKRISLRRLRRALVEYSVAIEQLNHFQQQQHQHQSQNEKQSGEKEGDKTHQTQPKKFSFESVHPDEANTKSSLSKSDSGERIRSQTW